MKRTKRNILTIVLCVLSMMVFCVAGLFTIQTNKVFAAENTRDNISQFNCLNYVRIDATYEFIKLNNNECSVRITNKTEATAAYIPTYGTIDGKDYLVTEIASNGFISTTNLYIVDLPSEIRKIGNMAFANCTNLEIINFNNKISEIGNNAFYRCKSLELVIIPKNVTVMGSYVFRDNNTQVEVRASKSDCDNSWNSNWISGNNNQDVHYNSEYFMPPQVEGITNKFARTDDNFLGFVITSGQPNYNNLDALKPEAYNKGDIVIPATCRYTDDKDYPILAIAENAYRDAIFENFIIEYSEETILIGSNALEFASGKNVIFNRFVEYKDIMDKDIKNQTPADNIFVCSTIESVILPKGGEIASNMFSNCYDLTNIVFQDLSVFERENFDETDMLDNYIQELTEQNTTSIVEIKKGDVTAIGESAFDSTTSIQILEISSEINKVGATILAGWDDNSQKVIIHNVIENIESGEEEKKSLSIYDPDDNTEHKSGWHIQWNSTFSNIQLDEPYYIFNFEPNLDGANIDYHTETVFKSEIKSYMLPTPTCKTANFKEWLDDDNKITIDNYNEWAENKYNNENTYFESIELTATWTQTITFMSENKKNEYLRIELLENKKLPTLNVHLVSSSAELQENSETDIYLVEKHGYEFNGFSLDGRVYYKYDEDSNKLNPIKQWESENGGIIIEYWSEMIYPETKIIYNFNGGKQFFGEYPSVIKKGESLKIGEPYKFECNFEGWYSSGSKLTDSTLLGIGKEQITVTAQWSIRENVTKRTQFPETATSVIIDSDGYYTISKNYAGELSIIIAPNVTEVHLSCSVYRYFPNVTITIKTNKYLPRKCNLYLENIGIKAPIGQAAIYMCRESDSGSGSGSSSGSTYIPTNPNIIPYIPPIITGPTFPIIKPTVNNYSLLSYNVASNEHGCLNLYAYGDVKIYGGDGGNKSDSNAGCAIFCEELMVKHIDKLYIIGGDANELSGEAGCGVVAVYSADFYDENFIRGFIEILGGNKTISKIIGSAIIYEKKQAERVCILIGN